MSNGSCKESNKGNISKIFLFLKRRRKEILLLLNTFLLITYLIFYNYKCPRVYGVCLYMYFSVIERKYIHI